MDLKNVGPTELSAPSSKLYQGAARAAVPIWAILAKAIAIHTGSGPIMTIEAC